MKNEAAWPEINIGFGVDGQGKTKRLCEGGLDLPDQPEARAELRVYGRPTDRGGASE
jgi:hypothetical protein